MRESLWHEQKFCLEKQWEVHPDREVEQDQSTRGPAGQHEGLGIDGSGYGSSLPFIFLLSPCLYLGDMTSAHDKKQNLVAFHGHGPGHELLAIRWTASEREFTTVKS